MTNKTKDNLCSFEQQKFEDLLTRTEWEELYRVIYHFTHIRNVLECMQLAEKGELPEWEELTMKTVERTQDKSEKASLLAYFEEYKSKEVSMKYIQLDDWWFYGIYFILYIYI